MRTTRRAWRWAAVALVAGCGGKYEVGLYPDDAGAGTGGPASGAGSTSSASTTGTSTGSTGVTTSVTTTGGSNGSGAGGSSGSGGVVDPCVLTSMKSCQTVGCHGGSTVSANLNLDASTLVTDFRTLVRRNSGDYSY